MGLRGYLTKYDCSSADVNPIGNCSSSSPCRCEPSLVLYNQLKLRLELRLQLVIQDELEHQCWIAQQAAACAETVLVACVN